MERASCSKHHALYSSGGRPAEARGVLCSRAGSPGRSCGFWLDEMYSHTNSGKTAGGTYNAGGLAGTQRAAGR